MCHRARMQCPLAAITAVLAANAPPESQPHPQQAQPPSDQAKPQADHYQGGDKADGHRSPPQILEIYLQCIHSSDWQKAECHDANNQAEVGRVENVATLPSDHILRKQGEPSNRRERPPASCGPPIAVFGAGHPEDECDPVSGEHGAGGPHQRASLPESDRDLEGSADSDRHQDLRDREIELEDDLPKYLDGCDDESNVQPWVGAARHHREISSG